MSTGRPSEPRVSEEDVSKARELCEKAPGYSVTADGRVFSTESNWRGYGPRELAQHPNSHGYPRVRLVADGRRMTALVHVLVAAAFLPAQPSPLHQIRHLNGDRTDNRAGNLAWGTAKENADDRAAHGTTARGERNGASRLTAESVNDIRAERGLSQRALAKKYGVSQPAIGQILRGEIWRAA